MKFIVDRKISLLEALALLSPDSSKSKLREWLKHERVFVDGEPIKVASTLLEPGQEVSVGKKENTLSAGIKIRFSDEHLVVIDKPDKLLSVAKENGAEISAHDILKNHYHHQRVYPVHRLDKGTSGLLLFALSEEGRDQLKEMFEKREVSRVYHAIVEGHLSEGEGTWKSYLLEDGNLVMRVTHDPTKGKKAVTHYKVIGQSKNHTLLELKLETGRKNQIRVQASEAGHPVAGDKKYGAKGDPIKRLCLHACRLFFKHPFTEKKMEFESTTPEIFSKIVAPFNS